LGYLVSEKVPSPSITWEVAKKAGLEATLVSIAASCINTALESAANEPQPHNKVFSPHNWIKSKSALTSIKAAVRQYFGMLPTMPNGKETAAKLKATLKLDSSAFEDRWAAD